MLLVTSVRGDEPRFTFPEFIGNGVVYPEYANPFVDEFAVQQLASEWARSDCTALVTGDSFEGFHRPPLIGDGVAEHVEEGGLEESVELGEGLAALGPQGVRRIQNPRNPLLLGERRKGDLEVFDDLLGYLLERRSSAFASWICFSWALNHQKR